MHPQKPRPPCPLYTTELAPVISSAAFTYPAASAIASTLPALLSMHPSSDTAWQGWKYLQFCQIFSLVTTAWTPCLTGEEAAMSSSCPQAACGELLLPSEDRELQVWLSELPQVSFFSSSSALSYPEGPLQGLTAGFRSLLTGPPRPSWKASLRWPRHDLHSKLASVAPPERKKAFHFPCFLARIKTQTCVYMSV